MLKMEEEKKMKREEVLIVTFKSIYEHYRAEYLNLKSNTIRFIDGKDRRFKILKDYRDGKITNLDIQIKCVGTNESFIRTVKHVAYFFDKDKDIDMYIISW
jgi:hypothetical protein